MGAFATMTNSARWTPPRQPLSRVAGRLRLATVIGIALVCAACGSNPSPTPSAPTSQSAAPITTSADPNDLRNCITSEDVRLRSIAGGTAPSFAYVPGGGEIVVLSEQSDTVGCDWVPFANVLHSAGFGVVIYDVTFDAPIDTLQRVVSKIRLMAPNHALELVGASQGAKSALVVAAGLKSPVDTVVSLSAEQYLNGADVTPYVRRLKVPVLFVTATKDPYGSNSAATTFMHAITTQSQLLRVPGDAHGIDLLSKQTRARVQPTVMRWLRSHSTGS